MSAITNQAESSKSGGLESLKYYVFDGEYDDIWNEYSAGVRGDQRMGERTYE